MGVLPPLFYIFLAKNFFKKFRFVSGSGKYHMLKQIALGSVKSLSNQILNGRLIYILIGLWMIVRLTEYSTIIVSNHSAFHYQLKINKILCILFVLFYLYKWIFDSKDKLNLICCLFFVVVCCCLRKLSCTTLVFDLFFIPLFLCQFLDKKTFYKYVLLSLCLFLLIIISLYFFGFTHDLANFTRQTGTSRYAFGLRHPNSLGFCAVLFCFFYVLLKENIKSYDFLLFIALAYFCYKVPNSMTSSALIILLTVCGICIKLFLGKPLSKRHNLLILFLYLSLVALVVFFTYYISFTEAFKSYLLNMPGSIWARFELGRKGYEMFGFTLFGKFYEFHSVINDIIKTTGPVYVWLVLDCAYFFIPIVHGVIVFLIFLAMLIWSLIRGVLSHKYLYALIIFIVVLYGVSENVIFSAVMMPVFAYTFFSSVKDKS